MSTTQTVMLTWPDANCEGVTAGTLQRMRVEVQMTIEHTAGGTVLRITEPPLPNDTPLMVSCSLPEVGPLAGETAVIVAAIHR